MVNGFRFQTKELESRRKTQNCGVLVRGDDSDSKKEYYGIVEDIYELSYRGNRKVYLFRCHWWDVAHLGKGYKIDKYGFTSVNTRCALRTNEPFVLASQSLQVFYLNDMIDKEWFVVVKTNRHDLYNMPEKNDSCIEVEDEVLLNGEAYQQEEVEFNMLRTDDQEIDIVVSLHRGDVEPQSINYNDASEQAQKSVHNQEEDFIDDNQIDMSENEEIEEENIDIEDSDME
ncbi:uncharacterized protein LOC132042500 isoform X1 [Lycium ferocissimum]|uniref:uncharacterized protein LOC132042500 isoform X1 n=1 Tax=Lycium ferocissimum TaxID=112874 RepID=UPI002815E5A7|nr:uncharacterized protein LOC132042500 isoform X1 [Lycium ferocissimum]XP_059289004.1 uncharacterized protein LOC132042500 isoform X1 [Lycium ferocissimum]XP_059289005.1 uncharacterized protein LOC132042500 isoform X1 [Lycium ferocissimum]